MSEAGCLRVGLSRSGRGDRSCVVLSSPWNGNDELMVEDLLSGDMTRLTDNQATDGDPAGRRMGVRSSLSPTATATRRSTP